jgi:serine/threonine protein kinase/WD40 repeat protein
MSDDASECDPVEEAAESFLARYRRGEWPSLSEYADRYPELADCIRELFPALVLIEEVGSLGGSKADPPPGAAPAGGQPFRQLGEYRILREVGRGGMGVVYEAVQESLGRHVALKVLPAHAALAPTYLERFEREAQAAARLHHTNIVPVFGVGECGGVHYYAMQFIQGLGLDCVLQELRQLRHVQDHPSSATEMPTHLALGRSVAQGLLTGQFAAADGEAANPEATAPGGSPLVVAGEDSELTAQSETQYFRSVARVGVQVAEALAHAHQQGVVHRDVKPSNLLLDTRGMVWVTDFGLAKAAGSDELTSPGEIVGTLRYMAPERFQGVTDARGDVYSLGATLYELLTLRLPFDDADRLGLIRRVLHEAPAPPRKIDPRVPRDLETIVLKAIEKDPERRFQTAGEMADELRLFLADRPLQIRRSGLRERCWRWCRRNPAVASLVGLVAVLLVSVAVVALWAWWSTDRQLRRTREAEDEATRRLYRSLVDQARLSRRSLGVGQRFESLEALAEATGLARELGLPESAFLELRNEVIACLALPDLRVAKEWPGWPAGSTHVNFDEQLERYVRVDRQGNVTVRRVAGDAEICHFRTGLGDCWPDLSPDGRFLLLRIPPRGELWELAGPKARRVALEDSTSVACGGFSPDGRRLALAHTDGSISLHDLPSGRRVRRLAAGPVPVHLAFHPGGRQLALACQTLTQIRDLDTGQVRAEFPHPLDVYPYAAWHPGGKTLATVGGDHVIHLRDVASGKVVHKLRGFKDGGINFAFSRAGDLLVSHGWEGRLRLWDPRTGRELLRTPLHWQVLHFSPDGGLLAADVKDDKVRVWGVAPGREYRTLVRDPALGKGRFGTCAFSPNGRLLAAGMEDGLGLWDGRTGAALSFVGLDSSTHVAFEPSGALLSNGPGNVLRWPVRPDVAAGGTLRVGPAARSPLPSFPWRSIACSANGRVLAGSQPDGAVVWHPGPPGKLIRLTPPHPDVRSIAVSRDGRWVVTGSHSGTGARVWEAGTGKLVRELFPTEGQVCVAFSPDGKWLAAGAAGGKDLRLWAVEPWQQGPRIGGRPPFAFSPDGRLLAVETGRGAVRLVAPESGQEYARLEDPNQDRATGLAFSPDGARLVVVGEFDALHLWDLRAIRAELAARGLDWGLPTLPPPEAESAAGLPLRVEVVLGDLAKPSVSAQETARRAIEHYRRVLARSPDDAVACNALAWAYLVAPGPLRDVKAALPLAQKAVLLARNNPDHRNTLGVAYYRAGRHREAVAVLRPNLRVQGDAGLAHDLYFLAMSYQRLGEPERARDYLAWAVRWSQAQKGLTPGQQEELSAFRAEAEAVLGVNAPPAKKGKEAPREPK